MSSDRTASERVPSEVALPGPQGALTERDRRILALEGRTFRYVGAKERAIREEIGLSKVAYYVRLNALLDEPAALRAAPAVVNRLRARRTSEDGGALPRRRPSRGLSHPSPGRVLHPRSGSTMLNWVRG